MKTPITYEFSTFQEMVDRVPADKLELCMTEMGVAFSSGKAMATATYEIAKSLAERNGVSFPDAPEQLIKLPEVISWIDDDKGEIAPTLRFHDGTSIGLKFSKAKGDA